MLIWVKLENMAWNFFGKEIDEQVEINSHYRGYLKKQKADILAFKRDENLLFQIILIMINFQVYLMK